MAAFISCVLRKPDIDDEEADFDESHAGLPEENVLKRSTKDLQGVYPQKKANRLRNHYYSYVCYITTVGIVT